MKLTDKQRVVLQELGWLDRRWANATYTPLSVHRSLAAAYRRGLDGSYDSQSYALEASVATIRDQLRRLHAKGLVLKKKDGFVISAKGRKALEQ